MIETDEDFRRRLLYVAGDGERRAGEILRAIGGRLDAIADEYGLRRRVS